MGGTGPEGDHARGRKITAPKIRAALWLDKRYDSQSLLGQRRKDYRACGLRCVSERDYLADNRRTGIDSFADMAKAWGWENARPAL